MHKLYMDLNFSRQGLYVTDDQWHTCMIHAPLHGRDRGCKPYGILNSYLLKFCLFVWCFFLSHSRIVYWYKDVTIAGEGLQILTFARHTWPLRSEGSLVCHAYCDTGHLFIKVSLQDPWHSQPLPSVWQWSRHYLICRGWEIKHFGSMVKMDIYQNKVGSILSFQLTSGSGSACVMSILSNGL